ncbi:MAG: PD40 domain-containing protein [Chitinophagales bacterium]|nr:PD40 domain-containing protein [Chitinophagales bacterium]
MFFIFACLNSDAQQLFSYSVKEPVRKPKIFAEGIISTGDYETHPAFSPSGDTLYFLKGLPDASLFAICFSYYRNGKWSTPEIAPFSGHYVDVDPFITKDGNTMYFASNRPVSPKDTVRPDWDIWKVSRNSSGWNNPSHLDSTINSAQSEYFPTLADNGNLYFGSGKKNGKGMADIYVSKFVNNAYLYPENLGDSINTPDNEYEPFIAPDESYLIFMATRPNGLANADFYISYYVNGVWSKAEKIAAPVNSDAIEWGGKITRDGKYFFFGSNRSNISVAMPQQENMVQFEKIIQSAGNSLGDIYQVDASEVLSKKK